MVLRLDAVALCNTALWHIPDNKYDSLGLEDSQRCKQGGLLQGSGETEN